MDRIRLVPSAALATAGTGDATPPKAVAPAAVAPVITTRRESPDRDDVEAEILNVITDLSHMIATSAKPCQNALPCR
jgi:hypothetical protein